MFYYTEQKLYQHETSHLGRLDFILSGVAILGWPVQTSYRARLSAPACSVAERLSLYDNRAGEFAGATVSPISENELSVEGWFDLSNKSGVSPQSAECPSNPNSKYELRDQKSWGHISPQEQEVIQAKQV